MVQKLTWLGLGLILGCGLSNCSSWKELGSYWEESESLQSSGGVVEPSRMTVDRASKPNDVARMIISPPQSGIYLGQTTFNLGEIDHLEEIIRDKVAIIADYSLVRGTEKAGAPLQFDLDKANAYADQGYAIVTSAYEAYPGHSGFTVDRLLRGEYDDQLSGLAAQFRRFRGQMFFLTCREPNGVLRKFFGGFGPNGDKKLNWAVETRRGFAEFQPPTPPEGAPSLYAGLGRDDVPDGIERLGAAQRYYYDFFVRREGLTNLTFETMGWATAGAGVGRRYRNPYQQALEEALSIEQLLAAIGPYYDWISINWHLNTEPKKETGFHPREGPRLHAEALRKTLEKLARIAPNRPILITELGILEPYRKQKAEVAMRLIMDSPQIKGAILWGAKTVGNPFDGALMPGDSAAKVLQAYSRENPDLLQPNTIIQRYTAGGHL